MVIPHCHTWVIFQNCVHSCSLPLVPVPLALRMFILNMFLGNTSSNTFWPAACCTVDQFSGELWLKLILRSRSVWWNKKKIAQPFTPTNVHQIVSLLSCSCSFYTEIRVVCCFVERFKLIYSTEIACQPVILSSYCPKACVRLWTVATNLTIFRTSDIQFHIVIVLVTDKEYMTQILINQAISQSVK